MSHLEACVGIHRLLMKGICDAYVLWPFHKRFIFELAMHVNTQDSTVKETFSIYLTVHAGIVIDWATLMKMLPKPWHDRICMYVIRSYIFKSPKKIILRYMINQSTYKCIISFDALISLMFLLPFISLSNEIFIQYSVYSGLISIIGTIFSHADCSHFHRVWCRQQ